MKEKDTKKKTFYNFNNRSSIWFDCQKWPEVDFWSCSNDVTKIFAAYWLVVILAVLTKPLLSEMLFDNFSLWKLTTFCIHCSPVAGESGCMYIRFGISGSAFPATIHRLLWNLYRQSSTATKSINKIYLARLSKPDTLTLHGGNMRLKINYIAELSFAVLKKMVENEVINYRYNKFTFN